MKYCRMLGHELPFSYCRKPGSEVFCRKIRDCWHADIEIDTFLTEHFSNEQIESALSPPRPKVSTLVDLIARAQKSTE